MWDSSDEDDGDDCFDDVADIIERELAESRRLPVDNVDDDADADVNDDGVNGLHQEMPREEMDDESQPVEEHLEESASWTQLLAAIRERDLETAELGYVERGEIVDVQDPVDVEAVQVDVIEMSPGVLVCSSESTADEPLADEPLADIPLADVSTSIGDTTPETEVPHGNTDERPDTESDNKTFNTVIGGSTSENKPVSQLPQLVSTPSLHMELQLAAELHLLRRQLDTHRDAHDRALHLCQTQRNLHTQLRIQAKTTIDNKDALERDIVALNARPFVDTNVEAQRIKRDVVASYNIELQRATRLQEELQSRLVTGMVMQRELDDKIRSVQRETQELQAVIDRAYNGIAVDAEEAALLAEISSLHNQWRSLQSSNEELLVKREAEKVRKQRVAKEMKMERRRNDAATVVQRYWRRYRARRRHICGQFLACRIAFLWHRYTRIQSARREQAAVLMQKTYRGFRCRKWYRRCKNISYDVDDVLMEEFNVNDILSGLTDELQLENGDDAAWNDYLQQDFTVTKRLPAIRPLSTATKEQHQEHKRILPKITRQHNTSATSSANNNPVGVETIKVDDDTRSNSVGSSRHEQGLENTASEWGISDQDLAENMYRNRRRYMNFIHKPEQRQKMQDPMERLKLFQQQRKRSDATTTTVYRWNEMREKSTASPRPLQDTSTTRKTATPVSGSSSRAGSVVQFPAITQKPRAHISAVASMPLPQSEKVTTRFPEIVKRPGITQLFDPKHIMESLLGVRGNKDRGLNVQALPQL